jgi:mRNA interferase HigB
VRVVSKKRLREFWTAHANAEQPLKAWYKEAEKASWNQFDDIKACSPSADLVGDRIIFNVAGNNFRLIVIVDYVGHGVLIRWVGTHAEYNKLTKKQIEAI